MREQAGPTPEGPEGYQKDPVDQAVEASRRLEPDFAAPHRQAELREAESKKPVDPWNVVKMGGATIRLQDSTQTPSNVVKLPLKRHDRLWHKISKLLGQ